MQDLHPGCVRLQLRYRGSLRSLRAVPFRAALHVASYEENFGLGHLHPHTDGRSFDDAARVGYY